MRRVMIVVCCVVGVLVRSAGFASAEPAHALGALAVKPGVEVMVETVDGRELRGRLQMLTVAALELAPPEGGLTRVTEGEVARIWERDGLGNGALIGGLIGAAGALLGQSRCTRCAGQVAIGLAVGVPFWAGVGAWLDARHHGRTLVFEARR